MQSSMFRSKIIAVMLLIIVLASLVGYAYYARVTFVPQRRDIVGLIRIEGYVEEPSVVNSYLDVINQAIINDSIKAVTVVIDSGGGYADYVEQIYLDLLALKGRKPLIASVVSALSGGYYIAVAADHIYVHPTSMLGNIGVKASVPPILIPSELFIETGAYKWTGFSQILFPFNLSRALDNFLMAVVKNRGDRLKVSQTHLRRALIYLGSEAVELGLADEIGSTQKAIEKAAEAAKLTKYEVVELKPRTMQTSSLQMKNENYTSMKNEMLTLDVLNSIHPPPAIHYIYLPAEALLSSSQSKISMQFNASIPIKGGKAIADLSHGNQASWWVLDKLIFELAKRNISVSFTPYWSDVGSQLDNASALIVASPTIPYSSEEVDEIEAFIRKGGLLLLFFDPAWEFIGTQGLMSEIIAPINSLSIRFGLSFAKGYLYNEIEYFGFYRNIYIRDFSAHALTQNLSSIVLFTATQIYSADKGVAWTANDTYSSVAERLDRYAVIAATEKGNGTVIAIGDLTFLMEPYCYVEDNYKLIVNIASFIANVSAQIAEREKEIIREEISKPDLPVGTEKIFKEWIDSSTFTFRWLKKSEREIVIERLNQTTHYYLTDDGALERWVSDSRECTYESPIPEPPYPLVKDENWTHESNFTLTIEGVEYRGKIIEKHYVKSFENIVAEDGKTYRCAKIEYESEEIMWIDDMEAKMSTAGYYWISSEAGTIKQELIIKYYMDDTLVKSEKETIILLSIKKG